MNERGQNKYLFKRAFTVNSTATSNCTNASWFSLNKKKIIIIKHETRLHEMSSGVHYEDHVNTLDRRALPSRIPAARYLWTEAGNFDIFSPSRRWNNCVSRASVRFSHQPMRTPTHITFVTFVSRHVLQGVVGRPIHPARNVRAGHFYDWSPVANEKNTVPGSYISICNGVFIHRQFVLTRPGRTFLRRRSRGRLSGEAGMRD